LPGVAEFDDHQCSIPVGWHVSEDEVRQVIDAVEEWAVMP